MVGVGVILAVGDTGQDAKLLAVALGELATQTLGRRSKDGVVVVILLRELVGTVAHVVSSGLSCSAPIQRYFMSMGNCLAKAVAWNWRRSSS